MRGFVWNSKRLAQSTSTVACPSGFLLVALGCILARGYGRVGAGKGQVGGA